MKKRQRCYHTQSGVNYLTKVEVLYGSGAEMYYREGDPYKELASGQVRAINAYQNFRRFYNRGKVKQDAKG